MKSHIAQICLYQSIITAKSLSEIYTDTLILTINQNEKNLLLRLNFPILRLIILFYDSIFLTHLLTFIPKIDVFDSVSAVGLH